MRHVIEALVAQVNFENIIHMEWIELARSEQLDELDRTSEKDTVLVFKHSSACSISSIAYQRINSLKENPVSNLKFYFLDVLKNRVVSNLIAKRYNVYHESPQVLLIKDRECFFECSHMDINWNIIDEQISIYTLAES